MDTLTLPLFSVSDNRSIQHIYELPVYRVELIRERYVTAETDLVTQPDHVCAIFRQVHRNPDREHLVVFCLDAKNRLRAINTVSVGDLSSAIVSPREVFKPAVLANAASIILIHNHPSGDPTPSPDDIAVTRRITECGRLLGIELLVHVVVGDDMHTSLKERGFL